MATYVKKQNLKGQNKVLINFIMDKSGSMASIQNDAIGGFNAYIKKLQEDTKVRYNFSLTFFNSESNIIYTEKPIREIEPLNVHSYRPEGWTALNDAIADTIKAVECIASKYDKIITVILTDGEENSSRRWNTAQVRCLIEEKTAESNWTILYLGATSANWTDRDVYAASASYGVSKRNQIVYSSQSVRASMKNLATQTQSYSASPIGTTQSFFMNNTDLASPDFKVTTDWSASTEEEKDKNKDKN